MHGAELGTGVHHILCAAGCFELRKQIAVVELNCGPVRIICRLFWIFIDIANRHSGAVETHNGSNVVAAQCRCHQHHWILHRLGYISVLKIAAGLTTNRRR
jgi:hypothetical protein